jgi:hypothetical protein
MFFAAPFLAEALGASLYVIGTDYNNWFGSLTNINGVCCGKNTEKINNDDITVAGYGALVKISERIKRGHFKRVNYIVCDTRSRKNEVWCNKFVKDHNVHLYVTPDAEAYSFTNYKPIYQYMKTSNTLMSPKANDRVLITHDPGTKYSSGMKGTKTIVRIVNELQQKYDIDFKILTGLSMDDCIREKSKSHIHVDALVFGNIEMDQTIFGRKLYYGGLGKSGLEAMLLNTCVVTSGITPKTKPYFDPPPVVWTSYSTFYEDMENLILDEDKRNTQIEAQNKWVKEVITNKEFYQRYLTE